MLLLSRPFAKECLQLDVGDISLQMPIQTARPDGPHQLRFPGASELAASAHPTRLAARLDPALSAETLVKLQKCSRLHPRLAELLGNYDVDLNHIGCRPDLLRGHDPYRAALLAGSIWHARSLVAFVSQPELAILVKRIGVDAHAFGIRHLLHAVENRLIADPEKLAQQIEYDGHACLGAWLQDSSATERNRVLLRLPEGTAAETPAPEHWTAAGQLLSLVLAHFETETPVK